MYIFAEKNNLFYKFHPGVVAALAALIFVLGMLFSHPVFLLALLFALGIIIIS